jgi:hypothetical protein
MLLSSEHMKLTRIRLEDYRCFGTADFDLTDPERGPGEPLDVALLVGGNGSGKSAVLSAVGGFFTALVQRYEGERLVGRDVRQGADRASIAISWRDWVGRREPHLCQFHVETSLDQDGGLLPGGDSTEDKEWRLQATGVPRRPTGLVTSFDVYRLLPPGRVAGPNIEDVISDRCQQALAPTVSRDGQLRPRAQHLKQWIVNLDTLRAKAKADRNENLPLWHTLRHALNTLLRPYTFEGVDDRFDVFFRTPTGRVPIEALSDGFRSVFVIVAELLLRLSLATARPEEILEQEAVCLIDEIDAHLHPRWQENVIPGLRTCFPNVQLIATTHSEIVVSTVEPKNVFRLEDMQAVTTAVRQDARFHRPERSSVSIAQEVFGARRGAGDPRWMLDPPPEFIRRFWELFAARIDPHQEVSIAEGRVLLEGVRDAHDRAIPGLGSLAGEAALFFVDLDPEANWAHPCAYVALSIDGEPIWAEHRWPPSEAIRLVPLPRPPGT